MKHKTRNTIIAMCVLSFGGMALYSYSLLKVDSIEYRAPEIVKEIIEVDPRDAKIKAREEELAEKYEQIKKLEARLDVLSDEKLSIESEIKEVQVELASFTIGMQ